jgi:hypothetical protein
MVLRLGPLMVYGFVEPAPAKGHLDVNINGYSKPYYI